MSSEKIAVLISGEYRTFPICRKTMGFLDDPKVDIYVSIWNKSIIQNTSLAINIQDEITEKIVSDAIGKNATILVEPIDCFSTRKYNDKMIHRWEAGIEMIKSSGVKYESIIIIRPDLFFDLPGLNLEEFINLKDTFKVCWYSKGVLIQDSLFAASYNSMLLFFKKLNVEHWVSQKIEQDWHKWLEITIRKHFLNICNIESAGLSCFCRALVNDTDNYKTVIDYQAVWRNAQIKDALEKYDSKHEKHLINTWGSDLVNFCRTYDFSVYHKR